MIQKYITKFSIIKYNINSLKKRKIFLGIKLIGYIFYIKNDFES